MKLVINRICHFLLESVHYRKLDSYIDKGKMMNKLFQKEVLCMTNMQVQYWALKEQERANRAQEALKQRQNVIEQQRADIQQQQADISAEEVAIKNKLSEFEAMLKQSQSLLNDANRGKVASEVEKIATEVENIQAATNLTEAKKKSQMQQLYIDGVYALEHFLGIDTIKDVIKSVGTGIGKAAGALLFV